MFRLMLALAMMLLAAPAFAQDRATVLRDLFEVERAFSRRSVADGTKAAWLAFLADTGVIFRPFPVNGKRWSSDNESSPAVLSWEPEHGEVASGLDFGYSTGPWEIRRSRLDSAPTRTGYYVTVWEKQPAGWKFVIDLGTRTLGAATAAPSASTALSETRPVPASDLAAVRLALATRDDSLASAVRGGERGSGFARFAARDVRLHRDGDAPVRGRDAARARLDAESARVSCTAAGLGSARSGDLGYTYGICAWIDDAGGPQQANYLRIWRRDADGVWQLVLDLLQPLRLN